TWCGEEPALYEILREEWGFDGFVLSDWYAATSTASARSGMDLEMPGPARAMGPALADAVRAGELDESVLDGQAFRLLSVFAGLDVVHEQGVNIDRQIPLLDIALHAEFVHDGEVVARTDYPAAEMFSLDTPPGVTAPFSFVATGAFTPPSSSRYTFSLVQAGRARVSVGGTVVIAGIADPMSRNAN